MNECSSDFVSSLQPQNYMQSNAFDASEKMNEDENYCRNVNYCKNVNYYCYCYCYYYFQIQFNSIELHSKVSLFSHRFSFDIF